MQKRSAGKSLVVPLIWCETKPVPHTLAGRETLNLDGSVRGKIHDGEDCVLDILERCAGAGGADGKECAVLWTKKDTIQDVVVRAESQHKAIGDKDGKSWSDWNRRESPEDRRRGVGRTGVPLGERIHVRGGEHSGILGGV